MTSMKILERFWILLAATAFCWAAEAPGFKVTKRYPVPSDGGFDYIVFDGSSNRLYVSHGTKVDVLDADSGKVLGAIADTPGVHGIAIVPHLHRGFTTNGGNATISVFDTKTLKTIRKISVDKDPDFAFYDPKSKRVLVCHGDAAAITAIDPEKEIVICKIDLGGGAEAAVADGKGTGFVNLEEQAEVVSFDPQSLAVNQKWPITGCKTPTGLAMDVPNSRLFIGCRSKVLAVMDANSGKVITTLPIGDRVDAVAFDADDKLIFASNGDGTVSVIRQKSADEYESVGDIQTQKSGKTMAFDPKNKRIFVSAAEMESVPAATGQRARTRPKPGSFTVLVIERQ
jgi:DNA-binding beta-propeller fold protein YncE